MRDGAPDHAIVLMFAGLPPQVNAGAAHGRACPSRSHIAYDRSVNELAAFLIAGGKSSRMGQDKAFLSLRGETLLSRSLQLARTVATNVFIVGDAKKFAAFGPVIEDIYPDRGPLGGIHAALCATSAELNLMLAVDLPFVDTRLLEYLTAEARKSKAIVTVPRTAARFQPLCAIYRSEFCAVADEALQNNKNKIDLLFAGIETRIIAEAELTRSGFSAEMFRNLNTPQDVDEALRKLEAAG
jgi:molybdenum cofactor guanylyltransferase